MHLRPELPSISQPDRNMIIALFILSLAQGNTIKCISIKESTAKRYMSAACDFSKRLHFPDPSLDQRGARAAPINRVLHEMKRWDSMPNRKEPITPAIVDTMRSFAPSDNPDHLHSALLDWNILGQFYGFRSSEWAQNVENRKNLPLRAIDGSPLAFIFSDITFFDKKHRRLTKAFSKPLDPNDVHEVEFRWRFQKNLDNGQCITQVKRPNSPLCPVAAALRIRERARRLNSSTHDVLAVFADKKGATSFITTDLITSFLQRAAAQTYNITKKSDLKQWTPHSMRVGACVLLNEQGYSFDFIKLRLRWRSDAFRDYLRNTRILASHHSTAVCTSQPAPVPLTSSP